MEIVHSVILPCYPYFINLSLTERSRANLPVRYAKIYSLPNLFVRGCVSVTGGYTKQFETRKFDIRPFSLSHSPIPKLNNFLF